MPDHPNLRLKIKNVKQLEGLSINDEVNITAKGKVISIEAPSEFNMDVIGEGSRKGKTKKFPGEANFELTKLKIEGESDFSALLKDSEDDA